MTSAVFIRLSRGLGGFFEQWECC